MVLTTTTSTELLALALASGYNYFVLTVKDHQHDGLFYFSLHFENYLRSMQSIRWLSVLTAAVIITACFFTWVSVESKDFFVGGFVSSENSRFGQPGILHVAFCSIVIFFLLLNKVWSIRTAFFVAAFNLAWAVRNFVVISACSGGLCPEKHTGLYSILIGSILLLILTPFIKVADNNKIVDQA